MNFSSFIFNCTSGLHNVLCQCIAQFMLFVKEHFLLFTLALGPGNSLRCSLLLVPWEIANNNFWIISFSATIRKCICPPSPFPLSLFQAEKIYSVQFLRPVFYVFLSWQLEGHHVTARYNRHSFSWYNCSFSCKTQPQRVFIGRCTEWLKEERYTIVQIGPVAMEVTSRFLTIFPATGQTLQAACSVLPPCS